MKLKAYQQYKDSGVDWLGEVPDHWRSVSLKWVSRRYAGGTPDKFIQDYWEDGTIPWLNSGAVNDFYIEEPSTYITEEAYRNSSAKWIVKDNLVIALAGQGKTKGMVAQLGIDTTCNQSMAAICPRSDINARFLLWWLTRNYINIRNLAGGDQRDGLNLVMIGGIPFPLIPPEEQKFIADFLDRETGKIDELIAKKEQLIERLKEKRTALISRAVTKGLNSDVRLKSSGVEWLGDVPEHWEVDKYSHHFISAMGQTILKEDLIEDGDIPVYSATESGAIFGYINDPKVRLLAGDIVIPARGVSIGHPVLVDGVATCTQTTIYSKQYSGKVSPKYLFYYFVGFRNHLFPYDRTAIPQITVEQVSSNRLLIPLFEEQQLITEYLDRETGKIDALAKKVYMAIEKLKEYRTALISAAVTGKIDVREGVA